MTNKAPPGTVIVSTDLDHVAGSHPRDSVKQSVASDATTRARKGASGARARRCA